MEATNTRLHPLLTVAAISVTVLSAVGVGALTGLVPTSIGSATEAAPVLELPKETAKAIEPAIAHPVVRKPAVRKTAPRVAQASPKPVVQPGQVGTIQSVREVTQPGEHTALGPIAGGVAGAVIGSQFGHGNGRKILTVLGAAGGAYAGREIEKQARGVKRWEVDVRLDSGAQETVLSDVAPPWQAGDRVRVVEGRLQPA
jgi:outer membrane lipoprotein SlyB